MPLKPLKKRGHSAEDGFSLLWFLCGENLGKILPLNDVAATQRALLPNEYVSGRDKHNRFAQSHS